MKKKFLAFGLAAAMVLGSAFSTFAATEDNTVDCIFKYRRCCIRWYG